MASRNGVFRSGVSGTGFVGVFLACGLLVLACGVVASAQQPTEAQILDALKGGHSRGVVSSPEQQRLDAEERRLIDSLRSRPARSITAKERINVAEIAKDKPSIDIEINFDYNSDAVGVKAMGPLLALGRALSNEQLKGSVFLVNGHTDAKGGADYNQVLSERRSEAVKRVLIEQFRLPVDTLIAVGYGKTHLKNAADPFAAENRRVQIVNTEQQAAAGGN